MQTIELFLMGAMGAFVASLLVPIIFSRGFLIFLYAAFMFGSLAILIARGG